MERNQVASPGSPVTSGNTTGGGGASGVLGADQSLLSRANNLKQQHRIVHLKVGASPQPFNWAASIPLLINRVPAHLKRIGCQAPQLVIGTCLLNAIGGAKGCS